MVTKYLTGTERKYRPLAESACYNYFNNKGPFSHGPDHHSRVWTFAGEILLAIEKSGISISINVVEALFFAVWFHDTGLTIDRGEIHGIHSRNILTAFLKKEGINIVMNNEMLYAVEFHDRKEDVYTGNPHDIHTVLSVADDLDSFGAIGVYRYLDIYSRRSVPLSEIITRIRKNMRTRYDNFMSMYDHIPLLPVKHTARFNVANDILNSLDQNGSDGPGPLSRLLSILESEGDIPVTELTNKYLSTEDDPMVNDFMASLRNELSLFPG